MFKKPVILCILDGFGIAPPSKNNAVTIAETPCLDYLEKNSLYSKLSASGQAVGLPDGQMGNSEVGHTIIGAGRVILQDLPNINNAIEEKTIYQNEALNKFVQKLKDKKGNCHLIGLASDGGVHSHINHMIALAKFIAQENIKVLIHAFTDGRDTSPSSAKLFISQIIREIRGNTNIQIASVSGRFYAMDRDKRWDRTKIVYDAIISGESTNKTDDFIKSIDRFYRENITDEFFEPIVWENYYGINDEDGLICINFRADRIRQLLDSFLLENFENFERKKTVQFSVSLALTEYSEKLNKKMSVMFKSEILSNNLGEYISKLGLRQLRVAETEKYAHVTFFFNSGQEAPYPNEERKLVASPYVKTYDLQPEMSAYEITKIVTEAISSKLYDLIIVNYANCDMIGHTGNMDAAKIAVETIDNSIAEIIENIDRFGGVLILTSDHGNIESMEENGGINKAHTTNLVPCIIYGLESNLYNLNNGTLADIAPTILEILGYNPPPQMTGSNLLSKKSHKFMSE